MTATLRGSRLLSPRLEVFARGDYLKNPFAGIDDRLKLSFGITYDNEPVPGFKKRDTTTSAAVVAKF